MCTLWHYYAFSGTNLLTRCRSASSCFLLFLCFRKVTQEIFSELYDSKTEVPIFTVPKQLTWRESKKGCRWATPGLGTAYPWPAPGVGVATPWHYSDSPSGSRGLLALYNFCDFSRFFRALSFLDLFCNFWFQKSYTGNILRIGKFEDRSSYFYRAEAADLEGVEEGQQGGHTGPRRRPRPGRA